MHIDTSLQPTVGADLSRTPPIYRPLLAVPVSRFIYETSLSALGGCDDVRINLLMCMTVTPCHPEPFASLKGKLREGSGSIGRKILRCAEA